jgi:hypothetical protein
MVIQQFARQLKQEDGLSPLLQSLQALRKLSPGQILNEMPEDGWIPWGILDAAPKASPDPA